MHRRWYFMISISFNILAALIEEVRSSQSASLPGGVAASLSCLKGGSGAAHPISGKLYQAKSPNSDGTNNVNIGTSASGGSGSTNSGRSMMLFHRLLSADVEEINVTLNDNVPCGTAELLKSGVGDDKQTCMLFANVWQNDDGRCIRNVWDLAATRMASRSNPCLLVVFPKKDSGNVAQKTSGEGSNTYLFVADSDSDSKSSITQCTLPIRQLDDDQNQQDSLLNNFSRTSVLFVSVSFIILMVISLAWLVFYYVQRFRYAHAKDRLARRLFNAAKKALTKIPAKTLRQGDKELDSDCPVCIEPYHAGDVIRILPCKHVFHKTCVDPWLLEHRTCPMCKMDILKAFGYHFGHSEESVRDVDQMSAGGQSTDGGSAGTGTGGRSTSAGQHGFPVSLPTDSDLHDPFFPSPIPSPSLLQPVLHSGNAQSFTIIPLTVHRQHGGGGSAFIGARGSDSSTDSTDNWVTSGAQQRQHSAEVHHGAGLGTIPDADPLNKGTITSMDDNHNDTATIQRYHKRHHRHREMATAKASNVSTLSSSSSASSTSQQRQPLFHSRSAGVLHKVGHASSGDSFESDDGVTSPVNDPKANPASSGKRQKHESGSNNQQNRRKFSAIVSRARSTSQSMSSASNKARIAVCSTPPPTASGQATTTTTIIGRASSSSFSGSECVVVGMLNSPSNEQVMPGTKGKKSTRNEHPKESTSLESL